VWRTAFVQAFMRLTEMTSSLDLTRMVKEQILDKSGFRTGEAGQERQDRLGRTYFYLLS
jgi:hypothetical protein